jgi:DNA-binding beta-propeller fold protein YncE
MKRGLTLLLLWLGGMWGVVTAVTIPHTPILYGTFLGGEAADYGRAIATDPAGNIYVTGETQSFTFPETRSALAPNHGLDVYVAKFNPYSGAADYILWFNALAESAEDYAYGLAVGPDGSAYVVGDTRSDDFCALFGDVPGFDTSYNGGGDAFILKIKPDGSGLDYCAFIGGSEADIARAVALDAAGNAYVVGGTWSDADFPITANAYSATHNGLRDVFVLKLDPTGTQVLYATYLGGSGQEEGIAIALDAANQAAITGWTFSADFPTTPLAFDTAHNGGADAFVAILNAAGSDVAAATYLGGAGDDRPTGIAVDEAGNAYVTGYTASPAFPTTPGAYDRDLDGPLDGFVSKLTPDGRSLLYSTLLGGAAEDWSSGLHLATDGSVYLAGRTWSADFPTTPDALSPSLNGGRAGFVARLSANGRWLLYGSYIGGSNWDEALAIAGRGDQLYLTGATRSADFPTTANAFATDLNGDYDIFVFAYTPPAPPIYALYLPFVSTIQSPHTVSQ